MISKKLLGVLNEKNLSGSTPYSIEELHVLANRFFESGSIPARKFVGRP
jgi:hypothetical protein